jgi:predicted nucleotidyltransferase
MYGLSHATINEILGVFENYPDLQKVILYGSRARGNYGNGSDIDFTLIGEYLDLTTLHKIENDLDDLLLPYKMDVSLLKHIKNEGLIDHINEIGQVFYEKEKSILQFQN